MSAKISHKLNKHWNLGSVIDFHPTREESTEERNFFHVLVMFELHENIDRRKPGGSGSHRRSFPDVHVGLLLSFAELAQVQNHQFVLLLVTDGLHFLLRKREHSRAEQPRSLVLSSERFIRPEDKCKSSFPILLTLGMGILEAMEWNWKFSDRTRYCSLCFCTGTVKSVTWTRSKMSACSLSVREERCLWMTSLARGG